MRPFRESEPYSMFFEKVTPAKLGKRVSAPRKTVGR